MDVKYYLATNVTQKSGRMDTFLNIWNRLLTIEGNIFSNYGHYRRHNVRLHISSDMKKMMRNFIHLELPEYFIAVSTRDIKIFVFLEASI